jgi:hypothetical protein
MFKGLFDVEANPKVMVASIYKNEEHGNANMFQKWMLSSCLLLRKTIHLLALLKRC